MEERAKEREKREEWRQKCLGEQEERNKRKENGYCCIFYAYKHLMLHVHIFL
jgi:hypothetical protein